MKNSMPEKYLPVKNWCLQKIQRLDNFRCVRLVLESVKFIFGRFPSFAFTLKVSACINFHELSPPAKILSKTCGIKGKPKLATHLTSWL